MHAIQGAQDKSSNAPLQVDMGPDSLVEIPPDAWPSLLVLFPGDRGLTARVALRAATRQRAGHCADFEARLFAARGDGSLGFVALWKLNRDSLLECGVYPTDDATADRLIEALRLTTLVPWREAVPRLLFSSVMPEASDRVQRMLFDAGVPFVCEKTAIVHKRPEVIAREEKGPLFVDDGIVLKPVAESHAREIDDSWPYKHAESLSYFEGMLRRGACLGLFGAREGDLRAWAFTSCRDDLHHLFVKQEHRRKGYAQIVVTAMSREISVNRKSEVYGCVATTNTASRTLFQSLNFEFLDDVEWILTYPGA